MMEATQQGQGDDVALFGWFHGPRFRSVLVQRSVRAVLMIIAKVVRGRPDRGADLRDLTSGDNLLTSKSDRSLINDALNVP